MIHRALFAAALVLFAGAYGGDSLRNWIATTRLANLTHEKSVEVLDRHGALLRAYPVENGIWRLTTEPADVDPGYLELLIAVEDKRFFSHNGVDGIAILRAGMQALWHGRIVSGGSTLTMQTARLIENSGTGGWAGKLRQIRVALALEQRLGKSEILSLYLTHAPFGGNLEGVRAASLAWFGKPPKRLAAEEAALLVALPQAPTARRPDRSPAAATKARDRILETHGLAPARHPVPEHMRPFPANAPHLADRARSHAETGSPRHRQTLTIDKTLQARVKDLARRAVLKAPEGMSAAILAADHTTSEILAYVGSPDYGANTTQGYVDMVQAVRSPGSTLKPVVYGLAFDLALAHPETLVSDTPTSFGAWAPQNFDGHFRGDVSVRHALEQSLNIPPVKLLDAMGPMRLVAALRRSGAQPRFGGDQPGLAITLGGVGLTLEELVTLYAAMAAGGETAALRWSLDKVPAQDMNTPALMSRSSAWHVGHILAGIQPPAGQKRGQIAFKTGTSYGHRDAWAIGYDGKHVAGVWLGRPDGTAVPGIFGGDLAAPILFEVFERIDTHRTHLPAPPPETLILPNALLPRPLQRFGKPGAPDRTAELQISFPPDGASLRGVATNGLIVKVNGGSPPFTVLANGQMLARDIRRRDMQLPAPGAGFSELLVLDSKGATDRVNIWQASASSAAFAQPTRNNEPRRQQQDQPGRQK